MTAHLPSLKRCPFCAHPAAYAYKFDGWKVAKCSNDLACGAMTQEHSTYETAAEAWNRRRRRPMDTAAMERQIDDEICKAIGDRP